MFPKAVTFLGSDSNSKSARLNDKKLLENFQGIEFLFFFEDGNYREIGLDHKAWPDKMSYTCRSQVKKGDVLRLYWTNKFYNARFITKGDSNFIKVVCTQMDNRLDRPIHQQRRRISPFLQKQKLRSRQSRSKVENGL